LKVIKEIAMAKRIHIVEKLKRVFEEYSYEVKGDNKFFQLEEHSDYEASQIRFSKDGETDRQFTIDITGYNTMIFAGGNTIPF